MSTKGKWWAPEYGFFGEFYMHGDNSQEGYLTGEVQSLDQRTENEVNGAIALLKPEQQARILDCPSGYGRHSIELAKRGFEVVGSDINPVHLRKARKRAEGMANAPKFREENMLNLNYDKEFDLIINMFYSFGFFESDEENLQVLQNFYNGLKEGGKFLMHTDVNIPFIEEGRYKHYERRTLQDGNTLDITDIYDEQQKKILGKWHIRDKNGVTVDEKEYSVRVYSKDEFTELCKQVGFKEFEVYGNWEGEVYGTKITDDMIFIAKK